MFSGVLLYLLLFFVSSLLVFTSLSFSLSTFTLGSCQSSSSSNPAASVLALNW